MSQNKKQHVIPRMYLQQFTGNHPKGQVWTYDKKTGKTWSASPIETGKEAHFYSVERADGRLDTTLETLIGRIENEAANAFRELLKGNIPSGTERQKLANFIALLSLRTAGMRRAAAEIQAELIHRRLSSLAADEERFKKSLADLSAQHGKAIDVDEAELRQALLNPKHLSLSVPAQMTLGVFDALEPLAKMFADVDWHLCTPQSGFFVTGDCPVIRRVDPGTVDSGDKFVCRAGQVLLPLTPKLLLMLTWNDIARSGVITKASVERINMATAEAAERFLFAHIDDTRVAKLGENFRSSRSQAGRGKMKTGFSSITVVRPGGSRKSEGL